MSGDCPEPVYWEDGRTCNNGANTCEEGQCIGMTDSHNTHVTEEFTIMLAYLRIGMCCVEC